MKPKIYSSQLITFSFRLFYKMKFKAPFLAYRGTGKNACHRNCFVLFLIMFFLFATQPGTIAQQLPYFSQYRMNEYLYNPATAGVDGYSTASLLAREQWVGFDRAPKTHALSFNTRIMPNSFIFKGLQIRKKRGWASRDSRIGLGAYIYNDRAGLLDRTGVQLTYAYHIRLSDSQLSFGLSANFYQFKVFTDQDRIILADDASTDDLITGSKRNLYIPDVNFGAYFMNSTYYAGFSATDLSQSSLKISKFDNSGFKSIRHYILVGGYKFRVNKKLIIEPNSIIKISERGTIQMDLGVKADFNEGYWAGLTYRTPNSIIAMGGVKVDKFYFGYAFDICFSQIQQFSYGTHELMVSMKFGGNARRFRWLNDFR